jgi:hypothetical protein
MSWLPLILTVSALFVARIFCWIHQELVPAKSIMVSLVSALGQIESRCDCVPHRVKRG